MAKSSGLLNRQTRKGLVGSNPTLSAYATGCALMAHPVASILELM